MTLSEVLVSLALLGIGMVSMVSGYYVSARSADWIALSTAAHARAMQRLEQVAAAKWDPLAHPPIDDVISNNFPPVVQTLETPFAGGTQLTGTNVTTITTVSTNPAVKLIQVDFTWRYLHGVLFTNTVSTYRAPDQ